MPSLREMVALAEAEAEKKKKEQEEKKEKLKKIAEESRLEKKDISKSSTPREKKVIRKRKTTTIRKVDTSDTELKIKTASISLLRGIYSMLFGIENRKLNKQQLKNEINKKLNGKSAILIF